MPFVVDQRSVPFTSYRFVYLLHREGSENKGNNVVPLPYRSTKPLLKNAYRTVNRSFHMHAASRTSEFPHVVSCLNLQTSTALQTWSSFNVLFTALISPFFKDENVDYEKNLSRLMRLFIQYMCEE